MSAASPLGPLGSPDRSAEQRAHEPSMEEILASIRRIIADDQAAVPPERAAPPTEPRPVPPPSLHDRIAPQSPVFARPEPEPEQPAPAPEVTPPRAAEVFGLHTLRPSVQPEPTPAPEPVNEPVPLAPPLREPPMLRAVPPLAPVAPQEHEPEVDPEAPLISAETDAAVASSFNALLASHLLQNSGMIADISRELLRPMLKAWLDDNLPVIVERLVRAEIERVARGAR